MLLNLKYKPSALPPSPFRPSHPAPPIAPSSVTYQRHRACASSIQRLSHLHFFLRSRFQTFHRASLFLAFSLVLSFSFSSRVPLRLVVLKFLSSPSLLALHGVLCISVFRWAKEEFRGKIVATRDRECSADESLLVSFFFFLIGQVI